MADEIPLKPPASEASLPLKKGWYVAGRLLLLSGLLLAVGLASLPASPAEASRAPSSAPAEVEQNGGDGLSPIWKRSIRQWAGEVLIVSRKYGIDPDLIAAVIFAESHGFPEVESRVGAVGLMGVMPTSPGLEWRPSTEELQNPGVNLDWGTAILADILRQSGGDVFAALAAYNGGWSQANKKVPRQYAADVLHDYGRAVAARSGVSPDIASRWTVAVELDRGHISTEPLILDQQPVSGLRTYGEHVLFKDVDASRRFYYVRAFAVPLALVQPVKEDGAAFGESDQVEPVIMARLGLGEYVKYPGANVRVLLACLPSLTRLRGHISTRWFAPSTCPSWHR